MAIEIVETKETKIEISKVAHKAITDIATRLLATPEFMAQLGITFFGRSFDRGGRAIIADGVFFRLGDYDYKVSYHAEPLRFGPQVVRNYEANIRMGLLKITPRLPEDYNNPHHLASIVGSLDLYTYFVEDQEGDIKSFEGGNIELNREGFEPDDNPETAIAKIPEVFSELYRTLKL